MNLSLSIHGPLTASVKTFYRHDGVQVAVVKVVCTKNPYSDDLSIFAPNAEAANAIADALNAAFAPAETEEAA